MYAEMMTNGFYICFSDTIYIDPGYVIIVSVLKAVCHCRIMGFCQFGCIEIKNMNISFFCLCSYGLTGRVHIKNLSGSSGIEEGKWL
jgi:hypothetical protein